LCNFSAYFSYDDLSKYLIIAVYYKTLDFQFYNVYKTYKKRILIFYRVDEDDKFEVRRKIKINISVNTFRLLDSIKSNLHKTLKKYYKIIEKEAFIVTLLDPYKKKTTFTNNN